MGQQTYRANLSAAVFPMTLAQAGRTVIVPQADQNFDRRVDPAGEQKDAGIPQAMYLENVLPTVNGYQSVGFTPQNAIPDPFASSRTISALRYIKTDFPEIAENLIVAFRQGTAGFFDAWSNTADLRFAWQACTTPPDVVNDNGVSIAYAQGVQFCLANGKIYQVIINPGYVVQFLDQTAAFTGIVVADLYWICSSYNYLIAIDNDGRIYWSSTTTPYDFVPSLVSGAGSQIFTSQTQPGMLIENPNGFYIVSSLGVTSVVYTGNARYPFKARVVERSGRYFSYIQLADKKESPLFSIDDSKKIQLIAGDASSLVAPELSTYLERISYTDIFDKVLSTFSKQSWSAVKINYLQDRYVLISIGESTVYRYVYIFDSLLQRYGRLKIDHKYIVESTRGIHFIDNSGIATYQLIFNLYDTDPDTTYDSVLVLGKFQYIRSRLIKLEEMEFESTQDSSIVADPAFSVVLLPSIDGKNFNTPVTPYLYSSNEELRVYKVHNTALNHSIVVKGPFNLATVQLRFTPTGDR